MPKENTHLWFARRLLDYIPGTQMLKDVSAHIDRYHLGSFIPDTFFYSPERSVGEVSEIIHGKDNKPTNTIIIRVLEEAKGMADVAFILGYISHCALDITFHPIVNSLSGDYYDDNPQQRQEAVYLHRHIETCIDDLIGNPLRIYRLVRASMLTGLVFEDIIFKEHSLPAQKQERTLSRQLLANRLFASSSAYALAKFLHRSGIVKSKELLSLFYGNAREHPCIQDQVSYVDINTGLEKTEHLSAVFARARIKALGMMEAAWGYAHGTITRERLLEIIPGESLSTGEIPANS
jgi:hypothetical protein